MFTVLPKAMDRTYITRVSVLAICYFAAAKASLVFAIPPGYATAVWPASGIALAGLLLAGGRLWPGIWIGAALANYTVNHSAGLALSIATGNTLEAICAMWLVHKFIGPKIEFRKPEAVFIFFISAALASVVAATTGVVQLSLAGVATGDQLLSNWHTWWQGDLTGIMVVTPCVLAWTQLDAAERSETSLNELLLFVAVLGATMIYVFGSPHEIYAGKPSTFLLLPIMAWAGCRYNERIVTLMVLVVTGIAIWATVNQHGPFSLTDPVQSLLILQAFNNIVALMGVVLCALARQRADASLALARERDVLEFAVQERTSELSHELVERISITDELRRRESQLANAQVIANLGSWEWDIRSKLLECSDQLLHIYGLQRREFIPTLEGFLASTHPDDRDHISMLLRDAYIIGEEFEFEQRILRPDGNLRNLYTRGSVTRDETGQPVHILGVSQDITEHKRNEQELRNYAEQIKSMTRKLIAAQEMEWRQLARDLHHLLGPNLTAMGINLQVIQQIINTSLQKNVRDQLSASLTNCVSLVQTMAGTTRNLMGELRPQTLDDYGLLTALKAYAGQFSKHTGIHVSVEGDNISELTPRLVDLAMFRITQEALNNIVKHSHAKAARVTLLREPRQIRLAIEDNGIGFSPGQAGTANPAGWGLRMMQERAEAVGARFDLKTGTNNGVRVTVEYPL